MNALCPDFKPSITAKEVKKPKTPKKAPNPYDTGTAQERMACRAQPLPTERKRLPQRPSNM